MTKAELRKLTREFDREWTGAGFPGRPLTAAERALHRRARIGRRSVIVRAAPELAESLGLSPAQGAEIQVRSELCDKLISVAACEGLTHAQIAKAAGASRTRVTAILNRNLQGVSTDQLLRILGTLGYRAKIILTKSKPAA